MTSPGTATLLRADCVILGGGIAGLWARAVIAQAGFGVVLVSDAPLGAGQTVASQGILHRGIKYAISPGAAGAANALSTAHAAWSEALVGRGPIDLRAARVLSPCTHLWTLPGMLGGLTGAAAAMAMRSEVSRLARADYPACFVDAPDRTAVWRVDEPCLDARTLVAALAAVPAGPILVAPGVALSREAQGATVTAPGLEIRARVALLSAGSGNEQLLRGLSIDPATIAQRRPLRMTMVKHAPFPLFGHCVQELSDKPRLTVTSAEHEGGIVWYIGGEPAERGVTLSPEAHVQAVKKELAACVSWADLRGVRFAQFAIDRAEARTPAGKRPDGPVLREFGNIAALWPTKLALAPSAAGDGLAWVRTALGTPRDQPDLAPGPPPPLAPAPWEWSQLTWT